MTLQDKLDWVMGIWHEDKAFIGDIICENVNCANYGNFTNCYDDTKVECYQHTLFKKGVNDQNGN